MNRAERQVEIARMFTPLMRTSSEEEWPTVREFLRDHGIDASRAAVGDVFPDQGMVIVLAAGDGRVFELRTGNEPHDRTKHVLEGWEELDEEQRSWHTDAVYGAHVVLSEEGETSVDPVEIFIERIVRYTHEFRAGDEWVRIRDALLGQGVDPQRAILVDWTQSLAVDAPPERVGTLYVDGRWFAFTAGEDSPGGRIDEVWTWRASDEAEARDRHGPLVDAALRVASREPLGGES